MKSPILQYWNENYPKEWIISLRERCTQWWYHQWDQSIWQTSAARQQMRMAAERPPSLSQVGFGRRKKRRRNSKRCMADGHYYFSLAYDLRLKIWYIYSYLYGCCLHLLTIILVHLSARVHCSRRGGPSNYCQNTLLIDMVQLTPFRYPPCTN